MELNTFQLFEPALIITSLIIGLLLIKYSFEWILSKYDRYKRLATIVYGIIVLSFIYVYFLLAYDQDISNYFIKTVIFVPLIFFIPGNAIYNYFIRDGKLPYYESLYLQVLISVLLSGWIALTLASIGLFSLANMAISIITIFFILNLKFNIKAPLKISSRMETKKELIALFIILVLGTVVYFHPFEYIFGGADAGIYINTGVNIANTGSILIHDKTLDSLSYENLELILGPPIEKHNFMYMAQRFPGYFVTSYDEGIVTPQFFYLYPIWIAIFHSLFGTNLFLYITPLFGLLATFSVYFASREMFDKKVAFVAAILLIFNLQQIWSARMSLSEVFTQLLVFSAIYTFALYTEHKNQLFILISSVCIGSVLLTRVDGILLFVVIPFILIYLRSNDSFIQKKEYLAGYKIFAVALLVLFFQSIIYQLTITKPYSFDIYRYMISSVDGHLILAGMFLVLFILIYAIFSLEKIPLTVEKYTRKYMNLITRVTGIIVVLLFIYGYFIRPYASAPNPSPYNEENLIRIGWYFSQIGLFMALFGLIAIIIKDTNKKTFIFLVLALTQAFYFQYNIKNAAFHVYVFRRFLPIVFPAITIFIAYFLIKVYDFKPDKYIKINKFSKTSSIILGVTLLLLTANISYPMMFHQEYSGAIETVNNFASLTGEEKSTLILFQNNDTAAYCLASPFAYFYGKNVLILPDENIDVSKIISETNSKDVYLITDNRKELIVPEEDFILINETLIDLPVFEQSEDELPKDELRFRLALSVYKAR